METYRNLHAEWLSWVYDWGLDGSILNQLQRIGAQDEMEAFIADFQKAIDNAPPLIAIKYEDDDEEEEEEDTEPYMPVFSTADERERWLKLAPQYPHPDVMLMFSEKARELERGYLIASLPEKAIVQLAALVNWQPFDAKMKIDFNPLLRGWEVNEIIDLWVKDHPESRIENVPDLDGNPQWYRRT